MNEGIGRGMHMGRSGNGVRQSLEGKDKQKLELYVEVKRMPI